MKKRIRYECEYCHRLFQEEEECIEHEGGHCKEYDQIKLIYSQDKPNAEHPTVIYLVGDDLVLEYKLSGTVNTPDIQDFGVDSSKILKALPVSPGITIHTQDFQQVPVYSVLSTEGNDQ